MVVELVPGEGQRVGAVLGVEQTVVGVLVTGDSNGREVVVVDPDPGRLIDIDEVLALGGAEELDVADDDVVSLADLESTVGDTSVGANTEHTGVADDLDNAASSKSALDLDHTTGLSGSSQTSTVADSGSGTASSTGGASGETDELIDSSGPLLHRSSLDGTSGRKDGSNLEETHVDGCW